MNNENLIPFTQRTESELRELSSAGGKASGESRRNKKLIREALTELLVAKLPDELTDLAQVEAGTTGAEALVAVCFKQALLGSARHFELIRDSVGEKPSVSVDADLKSEGIVFCFEGGAEPGITSDELMG